MLAQLRYLTAVSCRAITQHRQPTARCQVTGALSTRASAQMAEAGTGQALPVVVETKGVPVSSCQAVFTVLISQYNYNQHYQVVCEHSTC